MGVNGNAAEPVALVLQRYEQAPLPEAFAVQLVQRLRDQDPDVVPALMWLEGRLTAQGTMAEEIVHICTEAACVVLHRGDCVGPASGG